MKDKLLKKLKRMFGLETEDDRLWEFLDAKNEAAAAAKKTDDTATAGDTADGAETLPGAPDTAADDPRPAPSATHAKVADALRELGFKLEDEGPIGYSFSFEGVNFLLLHDGGDPAFINLALPGVADVQDDGEKTCHELMGMVNSVVKYVKAYLMQGRSVWFFYEREVCEGDNIAEVVPHMVQHLRAALEFCRSQHGAPKDN